jgi:hypothetical protein
MRLASVKSLRHSAASRCLAWSALLSIAFCSLFPGGSSLADEPVDLSQYLPFVRAAGLDAAAAARDDATGLRPVERRQKCVYLTTAVAGSFGAGSTSGVAPPTASGVAPVICKCLLGCAGHSEAAARAALRSVSEERLGGTADVCLPVATDVQFLS